MGSTSMVSGERLSARGRLVGCGVECVGEVVILGGRPGLSNRDVALFGVDKCWIDIS